MYDFIDLGSGKGGCVQFAKSKLGGKAPLCVELQEKRVKDLRDAGYNCLQADIVKTTFAEKSVRFVTMSHILEHIGSMTAVAGIIEKAVKTATEFIFIEGPSFDHDTYLAARELKFFWSDWTGHKSKVKTQRILSILKPLPVSSCDLLVEVPFIKESADASIHPLSSPKDQLEYDHDKHPPKNEYLFTGAEIYKSFLLFAWLKPKSRNPKYLTSRGKFQHKVHYVRGASQEWVVEG